MKKQSTLKSILEMIVKKVKNAVKLYPDTEIIIESSEVISEKSNPVILIVFLELEEVLNNNSNEKILIEEKSPAGMIEQYYIKKPFEYNIKFLITVYHKSIIDGIQIFEHILKDFKNEPNIYNDGKQSEIEVIYYDIFRQAEIFKILNIKFKPSIILQTRLEIPNDYKEQVKKVIKRNFYVIENRKGLN
ncbi:MAG: hypothetical protein JXB50_05075 [Spirochaetes bacterium]|nr:hypothetical protein [Spirochaetota bacterium]